MTITNVFPLWGKRFLLVPKLHSYHLTESEKLNCAINFYLFEWLRPIITVLIFLN